VLKEDFYNYFQKYYFYRYKLFFTIKLPNLGFVQVHIILVIKYMELIIPK
jgi:hypothetical protein